MNDQTYAVLRAVAREIRQEAIDANDGGIAILSVTKAVGFLVDEVHRGAKDIAVGDRKEFARQLHVLADRIDEQ
ncbi:hypothetical protein [Burkholderia ubonensis]|uniref:hypothetical protein n=1 Tax=Burkholderia ubonensis TaxID=101571 RepID=UPI000754EE8E|nr:hypothetical protein [Burkholderia ubonensis]KWB88914.1 hypothetical protein WL44_00305 [Burkholderia ubonensis]